MADKCIALCPRLDRATKGKPAVRKAADDFMCIADAYKRGNKKGTLRKERCFWFPIK